MADRNRDNKVEEHANYPNALRRYAEQPVFSNVFAPGSTGPFEKQAFEVLDVTVREEKTGEHSGNRTLLIGPLEEYAKQDSREQ